ncbi:hypothetical protein ILUMI_27301 [Ignelater luminosus]|uniref:Uncharacterized protein n=1 Tax=Ignelater luminosus TaxID=2038154 RepID=A0A8K0C4Q2_IGNLU|nr:hypothetical protein ILUMI_27301 [Ignelater luminosus]
MLQKVSKKTPLLLPFLWQCYFSSTDLIFRNQVILSLVGVQQRDPAGSMTFNLTMQPTIDEVKSKLSVFYLDNGTLGDDPEVVLSDFMNRVDRSQEIGLQVNLSKCELYFCSATFTIREHSYLECDKNLGLVYQRTEVQLSEHWAQAFEEARKKPCPFDVV